MRVDLGKERWAEIIDVDDVPRKIKLKVQEWALAELRRGDKAMHPVMIDMITKDMLMARLITAWSYEQPVPNGDVTKLGDLPSSAYDALIEATKPHFDDLDFIKEGRAVRAAEQAEPTTDRSSDSSPSSQESPPQDTNPIPVT
jgi:hypothetical protein